MQCSTEKYANIFKVLSDETRLRICKIISLDEICACDILEQLVITQSTLSYHMKILCESKVAIGRKDGQWMRYKINDEQIRDIQKYLETFCVNFD